jgi:uncharacterized protein (UPF0264 family)
MTTPLPFVRLLASVTSEREAYLAASHGADIIDCKDPGSGALGALPVEIVAAIRRAVPKHIPVSATIGDLPPEPERVVAAARIMAATGIDIVKVGIFPGGDAKADAQATVRRLGREIETALVAVMIADAPFDLALVDDLGEAGFAGVMLDTAAKDGRTLLDHQDADTLVRFVARARDAGLFAGLAGSLRATQIAGLLALGPDILGFRGALCRESDRRSALDAAALAVVRAEIPRSPTPLRVGTGPQARDARARRDMAMEPAS